MLYYICLMIAFVALAAYTIYLLLKFRDYSSPKEVEELYDEIDGKIKGLLSKMENNAKAEISKLEKESTIYINCVCNNKPIPCKIDLTKDENICICPECGNVYNVGVQLQAHLRGKEIVANGKSIPEMANTALRK